MFFARAVGGVQTGTRKNAWRGCLACQVNGGRCPWQCHEVTCFDVDADPFACLCISSLIRQNNRSPASWMCSVKNALIFVEAWKVVRVRIDDIRVAVSAIVANLDQLGVRHRLDPKECF